MIGLTISPILNPSRMVFESHVATVETPSGLCPIGYSYRGSTSGKVTVQGGSSSHWIYLPMTFTYPDGMTVARRDIVDVSQLLAPNQELAWVYGSGDSGQIIMDKQATILIYDYVGKIATVNGSGNFQSTVHAPMVWFKNPNSFPITITFSIALSGSLEYRQDGASCIFGMR